MEFLPIDLDDTRTVADTISEVAIADDLVERIYREAAGSIALITLGIANVESYARKPGMGGDRRRSLGRAPYPAFG